MNADTDTSLQLTIERLTELSEAAMRLAAQDAIDIARATGTPVILWRDGDVRQFRVVGDQLVPWDDPPAGVSAPESAA